MSYTSKCLSVVYIAVRNEHDVVSTLVSMYATQQHITIRGQITKKSYDLS